MNGGSAGMAPPRPETAFACTKLSKSFFGIAALSEVSLSLRRGHILGLIGENGAGKTTLMNIIGGVLSPDSGAMLLEGNPFAPSNPVDAARRGIAFIHQELNLFENLTVAENIFLTRFPRLGFLPLIDTAAMARQTSRLLEEIDLPVSPATPIGSLVPGERQLVEIAKALNMNARMIIFDEPTTSLTPRETGKLFRIIDDLKRSGKSIIFISHILSDVRELADDIAVLRDGEQVADGPSDRFSVPAMISHMVGRDIDTVFPEPAAKPERRIALEIRGISQPGIVRDISFKLHKGEVLGLFGLMGSGRSELLRMVFGIDDYAGGEVLVNGAQLPRRSPRESIRRGIAFITDDRRSEGLLMEMPIADNLTLVALPRFASGPAGILDNRRLAQSTRNQTAVLKIKAADITTQPARSLSGGNQQKTVIAKWLMAGPAVLMLDEPTKGIDVAAKSEVYGIINTRAERGAGVLLVSSEIEEVMGVCDRIMVMSRGEIVAAFERREFEKNRILTAAFREQASVVPQELTS